MRFPHGVRTTQYFHAPLHTRAHVRLFSLLLYMLMGCARASFQTHFTKRPNDPQPLAKPEGRERCRRQGDGAVDARAMELPLLLTFLFKQGRCHRTEERRKDERRRPNLPEHLRVECRGPGIEAWQVRSRADAPQVVEHGSHRMHIQQQLTLPR